MKTLKIDDETVLEDGIEWIYQLFDFSPRIMEEYYAGENFIALKLKEEFENGSLNQRIDESGLDGFMPKLVEELQWVMGEGNNKFDGYSFGKNEISFYFLIRKSEYAKIMNKIKFWAITKDLDKIISFKVKNALDPVLAN